MDRSEGQDDRTAEQRLLATLLSECTPAEYHDRPARASVIDAPELHRLADPPLLAALLAEPA